MAPQADNSNRSEAFGRLLSGAINSIATYEGRTALVVEEGLGETIGVSGKTIQRYKAGYLPPESRTVQIMAEAAVRRGYLGREWLQRFLYAAHYPFSDRLLDQLCPIGPIRPRPPRVYHNLPAPPYSQFVMREQAYADVIDGLSQRSAVLLIHGLSGNGKTSLAREVAARCLNDDTDAPKCDAAIWVSDKDRPGTTNLSIVLDEIARTLDYPGVTQYEFDEKLHEVEQLIRRQRVLLVVDNFETITDDALLSWLLRLPEPSKVIVTTREYRREFRSSWPVELKGMSDAEAQILIQQRLRWLRMEQLAHDSGQLEQLVAVTGGNPKAIEVALGIVKHERRPFQQVLDDLYAARGEPFEELFARAWKLLNESARRVLLAMPLFATSADDQAIEITAMVQGFARQQAMERLTDLALLDVRQANLNAAPRYAVHPLVRAFAGKKLTEMPPYAAKQRERWVQWCIGLVDAVGYCWQDPYKLDTLDNDEETILSVLTWTFANQRYAEALKVAQGFEYYYFVRGVWTAKLEVDRIRAEAAQRCGKIEEEVQARSSLIHVLCLQNNLAAVASQLPRLTALAESKPLAGDALYAYQNALASHYRALGRIDAEEEILQRSLETSVQFTIPRQINTCSGLADCFYRKGNFPESQRLFRTSLRTALDYSFQRSIAFCQMKLAAIELALGNVDAAAAGLMECHERAHAYHDWRCIADSQRLYARLHVHRGDLPGARAALTEAIDLFERLGMRRELAETRAALADLDIGEPMPLPA